MTSDIAELVKWLRAPTNWTSNNLIMTPSFSIDMSNDPAPFEAAAALEALAAENQRLRDALETARAEEREACAKVADGFDLCKQLGDTPLDLGDIAARDIAATIRERG